MFVMDVPPDVPPQYAPVVIAQASQGQSTASINRTIGVCHLIDARPEVQNWAVNTFGPSMAVSRYLSTSDLQAVGPEGKVTLLQGPTHGNLEDLGSVVRDADTGATRDTGIRNYAYNPNANYLGPDSATFLVEIGDLKIKAVYFFKVMAKVPGGTEGYDPYDDKNNCPNGDTWRISFNPDDPNSPIYTFEHPYLYTSALEGYTNVNLTFAAVK